MSFTFASSAGELIDYSVPMEAGWYVLNTDKAEEVEKKTKPGEMQWTTEFGVVGKVEEGFIDTEQEGRTFKYNFFQQDPKNPFTKAYLLAIDTPHTGEGKNTEFTFDETVTSLSTVAQFMQDRQFLAKVGIISSHKKDGTFVNNIIGYDVISDEVNNMLLVI